ncbi:flagellar assembly protein FliW [Paenibacillus jiagnxiensis]|uniref:flagellar assembly protein FliW n=1 Tax=Paenibacillus jiagnxiensis TaxID=3228926 RepID=UPI0033A56C63
MTPTQDTKQAASVKSDIFHFPKGLPGFEELHEFYLQEHNEIFSLLSAVDQPAVSFITVNPFDFHADYEFELSGEITEELSIQDESQVAVRCIVTWHSQRSLTTVNLLAPIIFNTEKHAGKQIILQNTSYTTKHPLWNTAGSDRKDGEG